MYRICSNTSACACLRGPFIGEWRISAAVLVYVPNRRKKSSTNRIWLKTPTIYGTRNILDIFSTGLVLKVCSFCLHTKPFNSVGTAGVQGLWLPCTLNFIQFLLCRVSRSSNSLHSTSKYSNILMSLRSPVDHITIQTSTSSCITQSHFHNQAVYLKKFLNPSLENLGLVYLLVQSHFV